MLAYTITQSVNQMNAHTGNSTVSHNLLVETYLLVRTLTLVVIQANWVELCHINM